MADAPRTVPTSHPHAQAARAASKGLTPERARVLESLEEARERTYRLVTPLKDADYKRAHHPVMGPVAWDVAHMGQQEDLWLVQTLGAAPETRAGYNDRYDAYRNPRSTRAALPLLSLEEVHAYHDEVRANVVDVLGRVQAPPDDPLWAGLYAHWMIVLHEHQHDETILQHLQSMASGTYRPPGHLPAPMPVSRADDLSGFAYHPGGRFQMGVPRHTPRTYDNEWPVHDVDLAPFWLQRTPVTNGQFLRFVEAGGYDDPAWWHDDGWAMVQEEGYGHPMYWGRDDRGWTLRVMDDTFALPLDRPVANVSWYEADAFARWAGCRLPSEAEWEYAATMAPDGKRRMYPWGDDEPTRAHANLDHFRYTTDPVGSHPDGASPFGVHQLVGDVWEWTRDLFAPYPGYEAFPYRDYSERFYDGRYRVLRGGSWASRPGLRFGTFRNWDWPIRRQIFAGLRLAADAPDPDSFPEPEALA